MTNIVVNAGETFRLNTPLTSSDTVTVNAGGELIAKSLSFIQAAGDIAVKAATASEPGAVLEIKHVAPLYNSPPPSGAEMTSFSTTLFFTDGTQTTLNTFGTDAGAEHLFQAAGSGNLFIAPIDLAGVSLPGNVHTVPTTFFV